MRVQNYIMVAVMVLTMSVSSVKPAIDWEQYNPMNVDWSAFMTHSYGYPAAAIAGGTLASFLTYHFVSARLRKWYERKLRMVKLETENRVLKQALSAKSAPRREVQKAEVSEERQAATPVTDKNGVRQRDRVRYAEQSLNEFTEGGPVQLELH